MTNGFKLSPWINNGSRVNSKTRPQSIPTHNERDRRVDSRLLQERALVIALLFLTYLILHESLSSCGVEQEGHRRIPTVDHTGEELSVVGIRRCRSMPWTANKEFSEKNTYVQNISEYLLRILQSSGEFFHPCIIHTNIYMYKVGTQKHYQWQHYYFLTFVQKWCAYHFRLSASKKFRNLITFILQYACTLYHYLHK